MSIQELIQEKRNEISAVPSELREALTASKHGAFNIQIFGSVARNEARPDSDVDFLVELEPRRSILDHAGLMQDLEDLLGRKVDVATVRGLQEPFRDRILKEAVAL